MHINRTVTANELERLLRQTLLTARRLRERALSRERSAALGDELLCRTSDNVKPVGSSSVKKSLRQQINVNNTMCKLFSVCMLICISLYVLQSHRLIHLKQLVYYIRHVLCGLGINRNFTWWCTNIYVDMCEKSCTEMYRICVHKCRKTPLQFD